MATLVIETATAACSVALFDAGGLHAERHAIVGRGHAEHLLPMIAALPGGGRADAVIVDCGPGSFTGIRVGLAAARALGLGWGVPVAGCSSLALIAAGAFADDPALAELTVAIEGGHGELFVQNFARSLVGAGAIASLAPSAALDHAGGRVIAGSGARWIAAIAPGHDVRERLPRAADILLLPPALRALPPHPVYGRAPDARPMAAA